MTTLTLTMVILAIALAAFGLLFALAGQSGERGYWSQRDPRGDAASDATSLGTVARRPWDYAAAEVRASLRIMAIGVILWWLAAAALVAALVAQFA